MTFGWAVSCDYGCATTSLADDLDTADEAMREFRKAGWFIATDSTMCLCPVHHRAEAGDAMFAEPMQPKWQRMPGEST